ncbi:hypothetical protein AVEN_34714-1 [Araneus ventricosus]|uniref:Uncharacterized protein n=1 Tax=Araneus ventricosus TaxID=182803 RepID=A0A4Y2B3D4_ARAVE|nr:hypothetical protein AVEN_34714-1 [Araneus ventricosus]
MTRKTLEITPLSERFRTKRLVHTYDLTFNRSHTRRIFSEIEFQTWNPPAPRMFQDAPLDAASLKLRNELLMKKCSVKAFVKPRPTIR